MRFTFASLTALFFELGLKSEVPENRKALVDLFLRWLQVVLKYTRARCAAPPSTCLIASVSLSRASLSPPAANGYTSARASPGLLTVSNGNSLGKVVLAKSPPPPPSPQMANSRKPDLRVITSQGGKSLMQMVRHTGRNGRRRFPSLSTPDHFEIMFVVLMTLSGIKKKIQERRE